MNPHPFYHPSAEVVVEKLYATAYQALESGDVLRASKWFAVMLTLAPRDERAWIGLGACQESLQQHPKAAGIYHMGVMATGDSPWCQFGRGRALKRLALYAQAEEAFCAAEQSTCDPVLIDAIDDERREP